MKYGNGRTSKGQKEWIKKLNEQGYKAVVCNGFEEARNTIEEYLISQWVYDQMRSEDINMENRAKELSKEILKRAINESVDKEFVKKLSNKFSIEQIAEMLEIDISEVEKIIKEIAK